MKTTDIPEHVCAACGHVFGYATNMQGLASPECGDLAICIKCGTVHQFDASMRLCVLTPAEIQALPASLRTYMARVEALRAISKAERHTGGEAVACIDESLRAVMFLEVTPRMTYMSALRARPGRWELSYRFQLRHEVGVRAWQVLEKAGSTEAEALRDARTLVRSVLAAEKLRNPQGVPGTVREFIRGERTLDEFRRELQAAALPFES